LPTLAGLDINAIIATVINEVLALFGFPSINIRIFDDWFDKQKGLLLGALDKLKEIVGGWANTDLTGLPGKIGDALGGVPVGDTNITANTGEQRPVNGKLIINYTCPVGKFPVVRES
jgi:hypothetical protein